MAKITEVFCDMCGKKQCNKVKHGPDGWESTESSYLVRVADKHSDKDISDVCYECCGEIREAIVKVVND